MIVADNETAVDLLYYDSVARTIVRLVEETAEEPLSVGIHGDWGAGKSSVLMMVEEAFGTNDRVLCVRFNGWLFEGYADAKAVLVETIVDELRRNRSTKTKIAEQATQLLRRVDWMKIARKTAAFGITAATGVPHPETVRDLGNMASALLTRGTDAVTPEELAVLTDRAGEFLKEAESASAPEQMHAFRKEFEELLELADIDRLVVLVDDLDRCLPRTSIETLEAIRLFLFVPRAAFVIAADEGMIEYAVRRHFPDLTVAAGPATYARNYLEKLIQVPFRLPSLGYTETRIYTTLLLILNECGEDSREFISLVGLAREVLKRPWEGQGLDRKSVGGMLKPIPKEVEQALDLAYGIAPILTEGTRGNPRQIKRFLNTMSLRLAIARERGFDEEISRTVLAKIMLAERFAPEIYDVIARGAAETGKSEDLSALEAAVLDDERDDDEINGSTERSAAVGDDETTDPLRKWRNVDWAKKWAKLEPRLNGVDLRPYVFVTREHRSLFGAGTSLGELDELLANLQGPRLRVREASAAIERLQTSDAERIFEALGAKVTEADDLRQRPAGVDGLVEVCHHHQFLQHALVALLRRLPTSRLGAWAASGMGRAFTDSGAKADYDALVSEWAAQSENQRLQAAARAAGKMSRRRSRG